MSDAYAPPSVFQGYDLDTLARIESPRVLGDYQVTGAIVEAARRIRALELEVLRLRGELEARDG
jgi:hypothetical protein